MIIGYKKARELLYLGDQIDAKTALDLAMVNRIVPRRIVEPRSPRTLEQGRVSWNGALALAKMVTDGPSDRAAPD